MPAWNQLARSPPAANPETLRELVDHSARAGALDRERRDQLLATMDFAAKPDPDLLKPHPHLLREAITDAGVKPHLSVLIGDSTTDIKAAHRAGAAAIA